MTDLPIYSNNEFNENISSKHQLMEN